MKRNKLFTLLFLILALNFSSALACTTAIISGKHTPDGRPLLWKHRDTGKLQNKIMFFNDGKYSYIGLVNSGDKKGKEIWIGHNSAGFAIMNSASFNLNFEDNAKAKDKEGIVMKMALQKCATLEDFEKMLKEMPKPLGVEANFGVIDANGGAAFYETGNSGFTKIDANNPTYAPLGYVIRTNYSFTGKPNVGYGYIRFMSAQELFYNAAATNNLTVKFTLQKVSRCLKHGLTKTNLKKAYSNTPNEPKWVMFEDYIPRDETSAAAVIQGIKKGEDPALTTMWTSLGFPLTTVTVPVWVGKKLPSILTGNKDGIAPLCDMSLKLKDIIFPITRGSGSRYMNINALWNGENSGILQKLLPYENEIISRSEAKLAKWRKGKINKKEMQEFYQWIDTYVNDKVKAML